MGIVGLRVRGFSVIKVHGVCMILFASSIVHDDRYSQNIGNVIDHFSSRSVGGGSVYRTILYSFPYIPTCFPFLSNISTRHYTLWVDWTDYFDP